MVKPMGITLTAAALAIGGGFDNLHFGGYLENRTSLMLAGDELFTDIATVRVEGAWNRKNRGGIEAHAILTAALQPLDPFETFRQGSVMERTFTELLLGSMTLLDSLGLLDTTMQAIFSSSDFKSFFRYLPYTSFYPKEKLVMDRALIKLFFKGCDLFIGRQTIAWGTGYAFNPTDIWNKKNPLDPGAPKTGINALRIEIPFGSSSGLCMIASPGADFGRSSGGFRLKGTIAGYDLSACAMRIMNADMKLLAIPPRIMAGADMAGQIGEVGVWMEGAAFNPVYGGKNYTDFDSLYVQLDAGCDYTFENGLYLMLEYYYNGLGQTASDNYHAADLVNMFSGAMSGFGRNYLLYGMRKTLFDRFTISAFALGNMNDRSVMFLPALEYVVSDNISVEIGGQIGIGDKQETEYGSVYNSILLKCTGYF
ncbi:MAG: hypothetical protein JXA18_07390 [Chitinispirillaceae bacterium]|nr:hypothetical protein [Chitinispirillaceae bacterium]